MVGKVPFDESLGEGQRDVWVAQLVAATETASLAVRGIGL